MYDKIGKLDKKSGLSIKLSYYWALIKLHIASTLTSISSFISSKLTVSSFNINKKTSYCRYQRATSFTVTKSRWKWAYAAKIQHQAIVTKIEKSLGVGLVTLLLSYTKGLTTLENHVVEFSDSENVWWFSSDFLKLFTTRGMFLRRPNFKQKKLPRKKILSKYFNCSYKTISSNEKLLTHVLNKRA